MKKNKLLAATLAFVLSAAFLMATLGSGRAGANQAIAIAQQNYTIQPEGSSDESTGTPLADPSNSDEGSSTVGNYNSTQNETLNSSQSAGEDNSSYGGDIASSNSDASDGQSSPDEPDSNDAAHEEPAPQEQAFVLLYIDDNAEPFETLTVTANAPMQPPAAPPLPRNAYEFTGWHAIQANGQSFVFDFSTAIPPGGLALYAQFSYYDADYLQSSKIMPQAPDSSFFTVEYLTDNNTVIETYLVNEGLPAPQINYNHVPQNGKVFVHWYNTLQDELTPYNFAAPVTSNISLKAYYASAFYVHFTSAGTPVAPQLVAFGDFAKEPAAPTRAGYSFVYWSPEENGSEFIFDESPIDEPTVLYAVWKGETVNYRVFYWIEKENIAGESFDKNSMDNFTFVDEEARQGTAGDVVFLTKNTAASPSYEPGTSLESLLMGSYFYRSDTKTLYGDGSTIINVFYLREIYRYFVNVRPYYTDNGFAYNVVGNLTLGDKTYSSAKESAYGGDDEKYYFEAKLGQDVTDLWPSFTWGFSAENSPLKFVGMVNRNNNFDEQHFSRHEVNLGVGAIGRAQIPANRKSAMIYSYWSSSTQYYYSKALVTVPPWQQDPEYYLIYNSQKYQLLPKGNYPLLGFGSGGGKPDTSAPQGFTVQGNTFINAQNNQPQSSASNALVLDGYWQLYTFSARNKYTISFAETKGNRLPAREVWFEQPLLEFIPDAQALSAAGYVFDGWYMDKNYLYPFKPNSGTTMPPNNLVLYAKWQPEQYTVSFYEADGKPVGKEYYAEGETVKHPTSFDYAAEGDTVPGKGTFNGWHWYMDSTGYMQRFPFGNTITSNLHLYAYWDSYHKVTYDPNGGTGTLPSDSRRYAKGTLARVLESNLKNGSNDFIGWRIKYSGNNTLYSAGSLLYVNNDIELIATYDNDLPPEYDIVYFHANHPLNNSTYIMEIPRDDAGFKIPGRIFSVEGSLLLGWAALENAENPEFDFDSNFTYENPRPKTMDFYGVWNEYATPEKTNNTNGTVSVGDTFTYTITAVNFETANAEINVYDVLPEGLSYISSSRQLGLQAEPDAPRPKLHWVFESVAPNAQISVDIVVQVNSDAAVTLENQAEVAVGEHTVWTNIDRIDVSPKKTSDKSTASEVQIGDIIEYTIEFYNYEDYDVKLTLKDILPAGLAYHSAAPQPDYVNGLEVVWIFNSMPAKSRKSVQLFAVVTEEAAESVENSAAVFIQDNKYTTNSVKLPISDEKYIQKKNSTGGVPVFIGDIYSYTLTVFNPGGFASVLDVYDVLPDEIEFVSSESPLGNSSSAANGVLHWQIKNLPSGQSRQIRFIVRVKPNAAVNIDNQAEVWVNSKKYLSNIDSVKLAPKKDTVPKPDGLMPGDSVTYRLSFYNYESRTVTLTLTDTLPPELEFVQAAPAPTAVNGQKLTWLFNDFAPYGVGEIELVAKITADAADFIHNKAFVQIGNNQYETNLAITPLTKDPAQPENPSPFEPPVTPEGGDAGKTAAKIKPPHTGDGTNADMFILLIAASVLLAALGAALHLRQKNRL